MHLKKTEMKKLKWNCLVSKANESYVQKEAARSVEVFAMLQSCQSLLSAWSSFQNIDFITRMKSSGDLVEGDLSYLKVYKELLSCVEGKHFDFTQSFYTAL